MEWRWQACQLYIGWYRVEKQRAEHDEIRMYPSVSRQDSQTGSCSCCHRRFTVGCIADTISVFMLWTGMDSLFKDLILGLTPLDPVKRFTARQTLAHPCFEGVADIDAE